MQHDVPVQSVGVVVSDTPKMRVTKSKHDHGHRCDLCFCGLVAQEHMNHCKRLWSEYKSGEERKFVLALGLYVAGVFGGGIASPAFSVTRLLWFVSLFVDFRAVCVWLTTRNCARMIATH
jgi:hypothetical protein